MELKYLGITGRKEKPEAITEAKALIKELEIRKIFPEVDSAFFACKYSKKICSFKSSFVFSFGGDGTILAIYQRTKKPMAVIGINHGSKGFLQAYKKNQGIEALNDLINGKIMFEERTRIMAKVDRKKIGKALNEVLVVPEKPGRIMRYSIKIGKEKRLEAGDGLIISTPTGSTAHALSAGGPIIKGNAKVFAIVPINPVEPSTSPLIINDHVIITDFQKLKAVLVIDGQKWVKVNKVVDLKKADSIRLALKKV